MSHVSPEFVKVRMTSLRELLVEAIRYKKLHDLARAVSRSAVYDEDCAALEKHLATITRDHALLDE